LLLIASIAALILWGLFFFFFEPSVILHNPEGIIHKVLTPEYGEPHIRLFRPPHNRRKQMLKKMVE
jgi:hypothetical protein